MKQFYRKIIFLKHKKKKKNFIIFYQRGGVGGNEGSFLEKEICTPPPLHQKMYNQS